MARPRKWESDAERMRAKRQGLELAPVEVAAEPGRGPEYDPHISEQEYVRRELEITRAQMQAGLLKEVIDPRDGRSRLDRSEAYARWRYREFMRGEVASL